jgi:methylmalonyl-CoA mutase
VIDPWGGSYYVESLTNSLIERATKHMAEIEELGGMTKAIETGLPKMKIEEAAARRQAKIDSGKETIIGVNKFKPDKEDPLDILSIDNTEVRKKQIQRIKEVKANRNDELVNEALQKITTATANGEGNLLELAVKAARQRATLGEISYAIEKVSKRHQAMIRSISGVYSSEFSNEEEITKVREKTDQFYELEGRRPRILIAKMGQDGHDRGAKVIATAFADLGFDVDIGPLFQTPAETAVQAVENDVHVVGMSSLAAGHKTLLPQLISELKRLGREDIIVIIGGVIPYQDYDELKEKGAAEIFGPGTVIPVAATKVINKILERLGYEEIEE